MVAHSFHMPHHSTLVWLGDLNYRVTLHEAEAKSFLANNDLSSLLVHDQLAHERKARRAFADFDEAPIAFPPSYKYDPGTDIFDTSEKRRTPSWCDRVLWRKGDFVQPHHYRTHMDLKRSDHKPVSLRFTARIKHVNRPRQAAIHQLILRDLDKFENECMPDATVSENALAFGDVHWGRPVSRTVVVENTGQVVVQMRFVPKLDEKHVAKPWLWINPPLAMLLPGMLDVASLLPNER